MSGGTSARRLRNLSMIAAVGENGVIGNEADLPWRLPDDLAYFKRVTLGHSIIMGRKTFDTMGKPLPKRRSIVLTRNLTWGQHDFQNPDATVDDAPNHLGVVVVHSVNEALAEVEAEDEAFVIGGGEIYELFLPHAATLYITRVHAGPDGDTRFPAIDGRLWERVWAEDHKADERNEHDFTYERWERIGRD
ncbi:dihydrofolate reductase [Phycisphaerales bacterium ac7]